MSNGGTDRQQDKLTREIGSTFLEMMRTIAKEETNAALNPPKGMEIEPPEVQLENIEFSDAVFQQTPVQEIQELAASEDLSQPTTASSESPARLVGVEEVFPFPEYQEGESVEQHRQQVAHVASMRKEFNEYYGKGTELFVDEGEAPDFKPVEEFLGAHRAVRKSEEQARQAPPDIVDELNFVAETEAQARQAPPDIVDELNFVVETEAQFVPPAPEPRTADAFEAAPPVLPPGMEVFPSQPPDPTYVEAEQGTIDAITRRPPTADAQDNMLAQMGQMQASLLDALDRLAEMAQANRMQIEQMMNDRYSEIC